MQAKLTEIANLNTQNAKLQKLHDDLKASLAKQKRQE